ncbi:unnamed protein product [Boreogadus saida]
MCPKQRAGLRQHLLLYTPTNLLAIESLLQFKQVDCLFSLPDIRASPANRIEHPLDRVNYIAIPFHVRKNLSFSWSLMTRAVLSILVMFVCLAHTLAIRPKLLDDFKMMIEALDLYFNSFKEDFDVEMAADSLINEQIHIWDNMLKVLPNSEPDENGDVPKTKGWATITPTPLHTCQPSGNQGFKQVDCVFSLPDIRASPANRMTRAVLSILVMFVCLVHTMEDSPQGDLKKNNEAMELHFNSLKDDYNTEKDALAEGIREQNQLHATLAK